ncbi:hypothetical protein AB0C77_15980 [Streptomyces sp. NPDC048629]|uniref:hypothetical protein n=1 Tax=Streptomyces sp. NPDC048629 TaxID=3154824 RepID=UPI003444105B
MAVNPTPVPTKIPPTVPQQPADIDPNIPRPETQTPRPQTPSPTTPGGNGNAGPKGPNDQVTYTNADGTEIKVIPSQVRPYAHQLDEMASKGYQKVYDLQDHTGGPLGDGQDEMTKALDSWYPETRRKLLEATMSLVGGIADFGESLHMMAQTATEAENNAQDIVTTLKQGMPE